MQGMAKGKRLEIIGTIERGRKMEIYVDADAVDFSLINLCKKGDIVVTQDYGVAAMALGKGAYGIHQSRRWYTNENIDQLLMERI